LEANDLENAFGVLYDLYQYESLREKYEWQLLAGLAYCMAFKMKDYGRTQEMLNLLTPEKRETIPDFYKGLLEKTIQELKDKEGTARPSEATPTEEEAHQEAVQ
jgi:hypothetical protein